MELPETGVIVRVGEGTNGSLTDDIRQKVWNNQIDYKGKTIEILFHQYTEKGSLRHPRMIKIRHDK